MPIWGGAGGGRGCVSLRVNTPFVVVECSHRREFEGFGNTVSVVFNPPKGVVFGCLECISAISHFVVVENVGFRFGCPFGGLADCSFGGFGCISFRRGLSVGLLFRRHETCGMSHRPIS